MTTPSERFDIVKRAAEAGHFDDAWQEYCRTKDDSPEEAECHRGVLVDVEALLGEPVESLAEAVNLASLAFDEAYTRKEGNPPTLVKRIDFFVSEALAPRFA